MSEREPLPPDLEALLSAEREYPEESAERRNRVKSSVVRAIAIGAPLALATQISSHAASTATTATAVTKTGLGLGAIFSIATATFVLGGITGVVVQRSLSGDDHAQIAAPAQTVAAPAPTSNVPPPDVEAPAAPSDENVAAVPAPAVQDPAREPRRAAAPNHVDEVPEVTPPAPVAEPEVHEAREATLAREREIIDVARAALVRNHTAGALDALRRHHDQFLNGQLAEERDALLVQTLVRAGNVDEASLVAAQFHARYPRSLFTPAVDAAVARGRAMHGP